MGWEYNSNDIDDILGLNEPDGRDLIRKRARARYHRLRDEGKCTRCAKPNDEPWKSRCSGCRIIEGNDSKRRRAERVLAGLCSKCGVPMGNRVGHMCSICIERFRGYHRKAKEKAEAKKRERSAA